MSKIVADGKGHTYELLEELGQGAFGTVFKARSKDGYFAIKVMDMLDEQSQADAYTMESIQRELYVLQKLKAPDGRCFEHVLCVENSFEHDGLFFMVTPFLEGIELIAWLKKLMKLPDKIATQRGQAVSIRNMFEPRIATGEMLEYMIQIAEGVNQMHRRDMVHLDLKPENIMISHVNPFDVSGHAEVTVIDMGMACFIKEQVGNDKYVCETDHVRGTPFYIAPEIITSGEHPVTLDTLMKSDIFSLGAVFFTMTTGTFLFPHDSVESILRDRNSDRRRQNISTGVGDFDELVFYMTYWEPKTRPTITQVLSRLQYIRDHRDSNEMFRILEEVRDEIVH